MNEKKNKNLLNDNDNEQIIKKNDIVTNTSFNEGVEVSFDSVYENELNELNKKISVLKTKYLEKKTLVKQKIKAYELRAEKEINNAYKFSLKKFVKSLLVIIDNIERAVAILKKNNFESKVILDELEAVLISFIKLLEDFGVKIIDKINIPFDPEIHQAISIQGSKEIEKNYIISIMQKGYLLNNQLLRPAMVIVSA